MRTGLVVLTVLIGLALPAQADAIFTWSGMPITGEAGSEYPTYFPEVKAIFSISGNMLTLTLTYTGNNEPMMSQGQALSALTWGLDGFGGTLTALSAKVGPNSTLEGTVSGSWAGGTGSGTENSDISGQWAYKSTINPLLQSVLGQIGPYGVAAMGDIDGGAIDTFGSGDIIDPSISVGEPGTPPDGPPFMIAPKSLNLTDPLAPLYRPDGFKNKGPTVQDTVIFKFSFTGTLTEDMFTDVQPLFGTEGRPLVPEPGTIALFALGLGGIGVWRRRRKA